MIRHRPEFEFSAGGLVMDSGKVLLIRRTDLAGREVYTFPKGKIEYKESSLDAAKREVLEETGIKAEPISLLGVSRYIYIISSKMIIKKVLWYLMRAESDSGVSERGMVPEWIETSSASSLLDYAGDRVLLNKLIS